MRLIETYQNIIELGRVRRIIIIIVVVVVVSIIVVVVIVVLLSRIRETAYSWRRYFSLFLILFSPERVVYLERVSISINVLRADIK
jgi:hypothetical protein